MKNVLRIFFLYLISRISISFIISERILPYSDGQLKLDNPILDPFILYDSFNYAQIAIEGYSDNRLTAFFPLFPMLVRGLVFLGIDVYWAGFLLANIFFILSLFLLDKMLALRKFSIKTRNIILFIIVFFPSSFYFSAFYTESFFLFLTLVSFILWEKNHREWAYIFGGLAAITRIVGIVIPIAFILERIVNKRVDIKDGILAFFAGCIFLSYPLFLFFTKGNPFLFLQVQKPFYGRVSAPPFYPIIQELIWVIGKVKRPELIQGSIVIFHFFLFLVFILYCVNNYKAILGKESIRWSEVIFTIGLIILSLSSVLINEHLKIATHGFMRYFLPIFPLFILMGIKIEYILNIFTRTIKNRLILYSIVIFWTLMFMIILLALRNKGFVA